MSHHREQQLSTTPLTANERAGGVCPSFFNRRSHQVPANWPSPVSRFMSPDISTANTPKPATRQFSHHAQPRRHTSAEGDAPVAA